MARFDEGRWEGRGRWGEDERGRGRMGEGWRGGEEEGWRGREEERGWHGEERAGSRDERGPWRGEGWREERGRGEGWRGEPLRPGERHTYAPRDFERERSGEQGYGGGMREGSRGERERMGRWWPGEHEYREDWGREAGRGGTSGYGRGEGFGAAREDFGRGFGGTYRPGESTYRGQGEEYGREYGGSGRGMYRPGSDWGYTGQGIDYGRDYGREAGGYPAGREGWRGREHEEGHSMGLGERMKEGWRRMTGHGPKGYKRSEDRIREDVCERIARSGIDADDVEVEVHGADVELKGEVRSRDDKRMLEDVAEDVFGVDEVQNHLRVRREGQRHEVGGMQTGTTPGQTPTPSTTRQQGTTQPGTQGAQTQASRH